MPQHGHPLEPEMPPHRFEVLGEVAQGEAGTAVKHHQGVGLGAGSPVEQPDSTGVEVSLPHFRTRRLGLPGYGLEHQCHHRQQQTGKSGHAAEVIRTRLRRAGGAPLRGAGRWTDDDAVR